MIVDARVHGSNQTDIICDRAEMRHKFAEIHAAVAVLTKSPWTPEEPAARFAGVVVLDVAGKRLQVPPGEFGFRVEQIDVTWPALHEHRNHGGRLRRCDGRLWFQIKRQRFKLWLWG